MPTHEAKQADDTISALARDIVSENAETQTTARRQAYVYFEELLAPLLNTYEQDRMDRTYSAIDVTLLDCLAAVVSVLVVVQGLSAAYLESSPLPLVRVFIAVTALIAYISYRCRNRAAYDRRIQLKRERAETRVKLLEAALAVVADRSHLDILLAHALNRSRDNTFLHPPEHPIIRALARVLPQATELDAPLLNRKHRSIVLLFLSTGTLRVWEESMVAMLGAVGRLGDARFVRPVRKLADMPATSRQGFHVRTAAQSCLADLEARQRRETAAGTMLRASDAPPQGASSLLRAAAGNGATEPQVLLRADPAEAVHPPIT